MSLPKRLVASRSLRLFLIAQLAVVGGAFAMDRWHSMLPLALTGSFAIMLTAAVVRGKLAPRAPRAPGR